MIAKLTGTVDSSGEDWAIIDVAGVGYLIQASATTLRRLAGRAGPVSVMVETHMREDQITLYGFADAAERAWFRRLTRIQGVGARVALAILSALDADRLRLALAAKDKRALTAAEGVGPKLAGRLVAELSDAAAGMGPTVAPVAAVPVATSPAAAETPDTAPNDEAVSALVNLGYSASDAFSAVGAARASLGDDADFAALIRGGLKELSR